ncbi:MAG: inorganic diphosphatase [Candidatus Andersenbacteria bacterium]|nr:inorganic diphosphatase [Candidatus Andersenbacteria bacterium]
MNYLKDIPAGEDAPKVVNVVIEIPKGSQNKYEYDKKLGVFKLDRVLFSPLHYPGDYGFIPQTLEEDGDPADALILINFPTYPGMLIEARPIGVLPMIDNGEPDHKILCVAANDVRMKHMDSIDDVEDPILNEIAHFFKVYKELEGKKVELSDWKDIAEAYRIITAAQERYANSK